MRTRPPLLALFLLLLPLLSSAQERTPALQAKPLSPEQIAIYREVVRGYNNGYPGTLNVANETERFNAMNIAPEPCLSPFRPSELRTIDSHRFPPGAFAGLPVRLVDARLHENRDPGEAIRHGVPVDNAVNAGFAAGMFTFSEIVFDSSHQHAALDYSFVCGALCGHGETVVFERRHGHWVSMKHRFCRSWIS